MEMDSGYLYYVGINWVDPEASRQANIHICCDVFYLRAYEED